MDTNLGILLCLIILGFLFYYLYISGAIVIPALQSLQKKEDFEVPNQAAEVVVPIMNEPERIMASSGPSSPSQASQENETVVYGEPSATDPYSEKTESANSPENLRHPERSYQPAVQNTETSIASSAGIASTSMTTTPGDIQAFNTDFIENRGEFMDGVFANDSSAEGINFSAF